MKELIGKVEKVFIPSFDMDKNIAFQVSTDEGMYEVIEEQTEENDNIYKGDTVLLTFQNIDGKEFIDINLYEEGDLSE